MVKRKQHHTVIADAWRRMVSVPGLGQRTGREQIVDKFWLTDKTEVIHHGPAVTHQEFALQHLKDAEKFRGTGDINRDQLKAEDILLKRGWIRGQIYSYEGLGLQGSSKAVQSYGHLALQLIPKPRRIYVMDYPANRVVFYTADQIRELLGAVRASSKDTATRRSK